MCRAARAALRQGYRAGTRGCDEVLRGREGRDDGPIGRCRPDAAGGRLGFRFAFELGAPPDAQCVLGSTQARTGPVAVLAMREDPTEGYWSTDSIWRATG